MTRRPVFNVADDRTSRTVTRMHGEKAPAAGDIVILCGTDTPDYTISVTPNPPALRFGDYDKALAWARKSATRALVDVWVVEDRQDATLVARHRPDTSVSR